MPARRVGEWLAFGVAMALSLVLLVTRWQELPGGLSIDELDSTLLVESLVAGHGLRLTPVSPGAPGGQSLLWLGVKAALAWTGLEPETWLPRISLVLVFTALVLVALRGAVTWRRAPRVEDVLPVLGLSLATAPAEAARHGSSAGAWLASLSFVAVAVGRASVADRARLAGLLVGGLSLVRLEATWLLAVAVPAWAVAVAVERGAWVRSTLAFAGWGLSAAMVVVLARLALFGALPLEGLVPSDEGAAATAVFLQRQWRWVWAAIASVMVAAVWRRFHLRGGSLLVGWVAATLVIATWSPTPRPQFLAVMPLMAMLVAEGLAAARARAEVGGPDGATRRVSWLAYVGLLAMLTLASTASWVLDPIMVAAPHMRLRPDLRAELQRRGVRQPFVVWGNGVEAAHLFPDARIHVHRGAWTEAEVDALLSEGPPELVDPDIDLGGAGRLGPLYAAGPGGARWLVGQDQAEDGRCPGERQVLASLPAGGLLELLEADLHAEHPAEALRRWRCAVAAVPSEGLPGPAERRVLADLAEAKAEAWSAGGLLEMATRGLSLAAEVSGEDVHLRARAERARRRWLEERRAPR